MATLPPLPPNEVSRLEVLRQLGILDTPAEKEFDDLVRLASRICDVPISLISLIDADRQWFKAKIGIEGSETPRDLAFCAHAIVQQELFVVPDALDDERFADHPAVTGDLGIRFYAGMPLVTEEGQSLGTLCVIDTVPRQLTPDQQEALRVLARQVVAQIEIRKQIREWEHVCAAQRYAQTKLLESEERYRDLFENAHDLIQAIALDGSFLFVNRAWREMLGYSEDELKGMTLHDVVHPAALEHYLSVRQRAIAGEKVDNFLTRFITKEGQVLVLEGNINCRIENGQIIATRSIYRDVTERQLLEEEETRLRCQLEAANQELSDFAYVVSHDLKAPLRAIASLAGWIADDNADNLDEDGREHLALLQSRVQRMHNLIEGILQYSRLGRIAEDDAPVDLQSLVSEVIDSLAPPSHVEVRIAHPLPTVHGDRTRLGQLFQNLLSNAIKFLDKPRGEVLVNCAAENGFWHFAVSDNGPGIEEKHFNRIFQLFQTLVPRDEVESTGIGLSLVKKIVEQAGGKVWVESQIGQGSAFHFTLPRDGA